MVVRAAARIGLTFGKNKKKKPKQDSSHRFQLGDNVDRQLPRPCFRSDCVSDFLANNTREMVLFMRFREHCCEREEERARRNKRDNGEGGQQPGKGD